LCIVALYTGPPAGRGRWALALAPRKCKGWIHFNYNIRTIGRRRQVGEVRRGRESKGKGKKRTKGKGKGLRKRRGELTPFAKIPAAAHGATGWVI